MATKTILFGLDGATYTVLDPLMELGVMPNLKAFLRRGTRATLSSTANPLTPPAWTSMITGCGPGRHGVFDFLQPMEGERGVYFKLADSRDICCETVWGILSRQGMRAASLNFVLTFPPQRFAGCLVPGFVTGRHLRRAVQPPELFEELQQLPGFNVREVAWDLDMEKKAIQDVQPEEYEPWIEFHLRRQQQWAAILKYVLLRGDCELTAFVDDGPDKLQHLAWPYLDPACFPAKPSARDLRIRELCREYFRALDRLLGEVVQLAGSRSRIFIASDHGFCGASRIFYLNVWLQQRGYLAWKEAGTVDDSEDIAAARMKTQYDMLDWDRTLAYTPTPSCSGIYIRQARRRGEPGVRPERYAAFRKKLAAELLEFRDPETGLPVVRRVLTREEAFSGENAGGAPDLTLHLRDYSFPSVLNAGVVVKTRKSITGTHHPDGIFMAAGEGIRKNTEAGPFAITDVCPALLYSAGARIPAGLDGRLPEAIFEPAGLRKHPPEFERVAAAHAACNSTGGKSTPAEDADLLERLKVLGYVE